MDMFDCVMPTRVARHGSVMTLTGRYSVRNTASRRDSGPLENGCDCYACKKFSRAYIRHLFAAGEMLGARLVTLHNLAAYRRLVGQMRAAIHANRYASFQEAFHAGFQKGPARASVAKRPRLESRHDLPAVAGPIAAANYCGRQRNSARRPAGLTTPSASVPRTARSNPRPASTRGGSSWRSATLPAPAGTPARARRPVNPWHRCRP